MQHPVLEMGRDPEPPDLEFRLCHRHLRIAQADMAHAPRAVARAGRGRLLQLDLVPAGPDPARPATKLGHPGDVLNNARAIAPGRARLLDRKMTPGNGEIGRDAVLIVRHDHPQLV